MIIKNSSSTKKKHDLSGEDSPWFLACKAMWFLVWENRCTHPSVHVTHQSWGAPGWEENCVPPRKAVSRVLFQGEESPSVPQMQGAEPTGRRRKQYLLRALAESVFPPLQGTLFCVGSFSWRRKPSSGLLQTQRGCCVPTSEEDAWPGSDSLGAQQPSKFGLHTSSTRPHLLKFLTSANYRPTMQLKK